MEKGKGYTVRMMWVLVLGGLLISGCVSLTGHNKLKRQYEKEVALFKTHTQALAKSKNNLEMQCNELAVKYEAAEVENQNLMQKKQATDEARVELEEAIRNILSGRPGMFITARGRVEIEGDVLFRPGQAELKESGKEGLAELAEKFKARPEYIIRIEGHTDSDPITHSNWRTRSNSELAAYRALKVLLYFEELGIDPSRMYLVSFGQYQPIAPNDSPENKAKNRRVVIGFEEIIIEQKPGEEPRK